MKLSYAKKKQLQKQGKHPVFGRQDLHLVNGQLHGDIPEPISHYCSRFGIKTWINFTEQNDNPGILILTTRRPEDKRKRILHQQTIKKGNVPGYAIRMQDYTGLQLPLAIANEFNQLYGFSQIIRSRNAQLELYAIEEAIRKNKEPIESHLEIPLIF